MKIKKIISTIIIPLLVFAVQLNAQIHPKLVNNLAFKSDEKDETNNTSFNLKVKSENSDLYYVILKTKFDKEYSKGINFPDETISYKDKIGNKFQGLDHSTFFYSFFNLKYMNCELYYLTKKDYEKQVAKTNEFKTEQDVMNYYYSKAKKVVFKLNFLKLRKMILNNTKGSTVCVNINLISQKKYKISYIMEKIDKD